MISILLIPVESCSSAAAEHLPPNFQLPVDGSGTCVPKQRLHLNNPEGTQTPFSLGNKVLKQVFLICLN